MSVQNQNQVIVSKAGQVFKTVPLGALTSIGRRQGLDVQIEDAGLSRLHALVQNDGGRFFLVDKNSTNGTWLNGVRLAPESPTELKTGDLADLGGYRLEFQLGALTDATTVMPAAAAKAEAQLHELEAPPESSPLMAHLLEGRSRIPVWSEGTMACRIADILDETHDTKTFRLVGEKPLLFSFRPGQFVTLRLNIDGKDVRRSYSISSSPSRPHALDLTIKRVPKGLVSNWMADNLKLGDTLEVRGPSGKFSCFNYPSRKLMFIGAGSGITPVMSMLRWIVDTAADVDLLMLVSARSPQDLIFRKELDWISSRHSGIRLVVTVTGRWTGAEAWTGLTGRCDARMLKLLVPDLNERHIFMCGPGPFMEAVKDSLRQIEFPISLLHTESFGEARVAKGEPVQPRDVPRPGTSVRVPTGAAPAAAPAVADVAPAARSPRAAEAAPVAASKYQVSFVNAGKVIATGGESNLLELAEANGIEIDYACRAGSCGSCKVLCRKGTLEMSENELDAAERDQGYVFACVARPTSDVEVEA